MRVLWPLLALGALCGCGDDRPAGPADDSMRLEYGLQAGDVLVYDVTMSSDLFSARVTIAGQETFIVTGVDGDSLLTIVPLESGIRLLEAGDASIDWDRYAAQQAHENRASAHFESPFFDRGTGDLPLYDGVPSDLPIWGLLGFRMTRSGQLVPSAGDPVKLPFLPRHLALLGVLGEWAQGFAGIGIQPWLQLPDSPLASGDAWEQSVLEQLRLRHTLLGFETVLGYGCARIRSETVPVPLWGDAELAFAVDEGFAVRDEIQMQFDLEAGAAQQSLVAELVARWRLTDGELDDLARALGSGDATHRDSRPDLVAEGYLVGAAAPGFALQDLSGRTVGLADHEGEVVLLSFWASWETIGIQQMPVLTALDGAYRDRGLAVLGVAFEPEAARVLGRVEAAVAAQEVSYPILWGDEAVYESYQLRRAMPTTVLVDGAGTIRQVHFGYWPRLDLEPEIERLLGETPEYRPSVYDALVRVATGEPGVSMDTLAIARVARDGSPSLAFPVRVADSLRLEVTVADDSPEDREGGGALFAPGLTLELEGGRTLHTQAALGEGAVLAFMPLIEGGFRRQGFVSADGAERIAVRWDFTGREYAAAGGPDLDRIEAIAVHLLVANDYRIGVAVNGESVASVGAAGNVRDGSNQAVVRIELTLNRGVP